MSRTIQETMDFYWKEYGIMVSYDTGPAWVADRRLCRYVIKFPYCYQNEDGKWFFSWKHPDQQQYNGVKGSEIVYYINVMFFDGKPEGFKEALQKTWKG